MTYYRQDSVPLEIVDLDVGEVGYDEHGNYIEIDAFSNPQIVKKTVLNDNVKIDSFETDRGLMSFWSWSRKIRQSEIDEVSTEDSKEG